MLTSMDVPPDGVRGRLAEYEWLAERVHAMCDGIDEVRGTAHSDDELVTAVVGGRGELLELELDSRVFREQDAGGLAASILATVRKAAADAENEATRLAEKLVPKRERGEDFDPVYGPVLHLLNDKTRTGSDHG
jgi:DNA-binding protein YbaB